MTIAGQAESVPFKLSDAIAGSHHAAGEWLCPASKAGRVGAPAKTLVLAT